MESHLEHIMTETKRLFGPDFRVDTPQFMHFVILSKTNCICCAFSYYEDSRHGPSFLQLDELRMQPCPILCSLSGTAILFKLFQLAQRLQIQTIRLYDASSIQYPNCKHPVHMSMAAYNILIYGQSWYNRMGYYQRNFSADFERNLYLIQQRVHSLHKHRQRQIQTMLLDIGSVLDTRECTLQEAFVAMDTYRRHNTMDCDMSEYLSDLVNMFVELFDLKSDESLNLTLEVDNPQTRLIYSRTGGRAALLAELRPEFPSETPAGRPAGVKKQTSFVINKL